MPFDLGYWKQWEGQRVDSAFTLERCLQGDDHGAVFETTHAGQNGRTLPATIRLIVAGGETSGKPPVEDLLKRWNLAAGLSHPGLVPLLAFGETQLGEGTNEKNAALHCAFVVLPQPDETLVEVLADRPLTASETRETIQPVLQALRYLESKGVSPFEFTAANVMAFGDQVRISSDNLRTAAAAGESERLQASAEVLRALGRLLDQMLRGKGGSDSALPDPFAGIIRNCTQQSQADAGNAPWTLSMVEDRLRGETSTKKPVIAAVEASSGQPRPRKQRHRRPSMLLWGVGITAALAIAVAVMNRPPSNPPPQVGGNENPAPSPAAPAVEPSAAKPEPVTSTKNTVSPSSTKPSPTGRRPETPAPPPVPPAAAAAPAAPAPTTTSIEGVTQVMPEIPQRARNTITGRVRINVRVRVDSNGNVTQARQDPPMGSQYFATRALTAAQAWKFPPGSASQDWLIRFELSRDQTRASAAKISQ